MAGTGASLLVNSILLIGFGQEGQAQSESRDEEERRKSITSHLLSGVGYYWLDNINELLDSSAFAAATTAAVWKDRVLGSNRTVHIPVKLAWILSGNNVRVSHEIARRCVPIRLDAKTAPLGRTGFKHDPLTAWIKQNRPKLIWACLTLIQSWVAQGALTNPVKPLASYEAWSGVMRGLFEAVGIDGFLGNLALVQDDANEEQHVWSAFIACWLAADGEKKPRPIGNPDDGGTPFGGPASLVALIEEHSLELPLKGYDGPAKAKSLAQLLRRKKDSVFDGSTAEGLLRVRLCIGRDARKNANEYWLELV
jgi:hypothetical protein